MSGASVSIDWIDVHLSDKDIKVKEHKGNPTFYTIEQGSLCIYTRSIDVLDSLYKALEPHLNEAAREQEASGD